MTSIDTRIDSIIEKLQEIEDDIDQLLSLSNELAYLDVNINKFQYC